jgi:hypothetical protein
MFYLVEFGKILKNNLLLSLIFVLSTVALITVSSQQKRIQKELSLSKQSKTTPYFNAIISKVKNIDSVLRRMKQLPGVLNVETHGVSSIQKQILHLKKTFGADVIEGLASVNYKRVKVEVESGLNSGSLSLIKEYLARLIGKEAVKIGNIKYPNKVKIKSNAFLGMFLKFFDFYTQLILGGLWLISCLLLLGKVRTKSFIIEKFQRKKNTSLKIAGTGFIVLALLTIASNYLIWGEVQLMAAVVISLMVVSLIMGTTISKSKF